MQFCLPLCFILLHLVTAANRPGFRTCSTSPFCRRYRAFVDSPEPLPGWHVVSTQQDNDSYKFTLRNQGETEGSKLETDLLAALSFTSNGAVRLTVEELGAQSQKRYRLDDSDVLTGFTNLHIPLQPDVHIRQTSEGLHLQLNTSVARTDVDVAFKPFKMTIRHDGILHAVVNSRNRFNFEVPRMDEKLNHSRDATAFDDNDLWTYQFGGDLDRSKQGPRAIGIDISYCNVNGLYGLAEHSVRFDLPDAFPHPADKDEPYRFWNSDVFAYELDSPMSLYASIPLLHVAHEPRSNSGTLWLNAAEAFVKLDRQKTYEAEGCKMTPTWWASETGVLDVVFLSGRFQSEVVKQYHALTGPIAMQQLNTLGLHQCRWNYENEADVAYVNRKYDEAQMPLDYIWLDIDHTSHRKYFTWNLNSFPDPQGMIDDLAAHQRNMVLIVDPHVKAEAGYAVHETLKKNSFFVKNENGDDFRGWCWPGDSSYPDLLRPEVRAAYQPWFKPGFWNGTKISPAPAVGPAELRKWKGKIGNIQIWNDMNEPSVFNKPEVTIPRSVTHLQGKVEHRAVHNLYGLQFHRTSHDALAARGDKVRPFVLTRAAFVGSHRYGPIWTGDNTASWEHARASIPMLLSLSLCGMSNSGADVGGFFEEPSAELATRWAQAGAWYPFFRVHSTQGSTRRELYLLPEPERSLIRRTLLMRYSLLPFWYTVMAQAVASGFPMITSILDFDQKNNKGELRSFGRDDGFLIGDAIFVRPNLWPAEEKNVLAASFVMPGDDSIHWYNIWDTRTQPIPGGSTYQDLHAYDKSSSIPVFVRAGAIISSKSRQRRSSEAMRHDPFTLNVYVDPKTKKARGLLYLDDYRSIDSGQVWIEIGFEPVESKGYKLSVMSVSRGSLQPWQSNTHVEKVVLIGAGQVVTAQREGEEKTLAVRRVHENQIEIRMDEKASLIDFWTMTLATAD